MMEPRLRQSLGGLAQALRRARCWRALAWCWGAAACAGILLLVIQVVSGRNSRLAWMLPALGGAAAAAFIWKRHRARSEDLRALVKLLERDHPELRHLLSAAAEQEPDPASGRFRFLQLRVIEEVLAHPGRTRWKEQLKRRLRSARTIHAIALAGFLAVVLILAQSAQRQVPLLSSWIGNEVIVAPGDTQLERGTSLVISARFRHRPPSEATLVLVTESGRTNRIPLARPLSDPVFGASLPEIPESTLYHIEYGSKQTREYKIVVFDYPSLVRADADLRFPAYTGITNTVIRDTRRVSAVEGTRLTYRLHLNKPVARARFVNSRGAMPSARPESEPGPGRSAQTRGGRGERAREPFPSNEFEAREDARPTEPASETTGATRPQDLPEQPPTLALQSNSIAVLEDYVLTKSARYSLELVDAEGRTNRIATDFVIDVLPNRRPDLKLTFPRGDQRVSQLQELQFQSEAVDDFGLLKYGVGFGAAGQEPEFVELGQTAPANEKRAFQYLVPLETMHVEADQVVTYFLWADDFGPDGLARRTFSDVYFAEVRAFDVILRPDQSGMGANRGNQGEQSDNRTRLAELQKEIVIATWKLQQEKSEDLKRKQP